jgi:hypothetical protein
VQQLEEVATVSVPKKKKKKPTQVLYGLALSSSPIVNWLLLVSGAPSPMMSSCVVCVQSF